MHIRSIELAHVMGHEAYEVVLPETGVVLVTGPNGIGKSTIVEAAPIAVWGQTLRGTNPWHTGKKGFARVEVDGLPVHRKRTKSRSSVQVDADHVPKFDTATKAQNYLVHTFGKFDAWRRTHVFSSHDAAHFTLATDAERKRLLESLIGLEKFDAALKQCRADLSSAKTDLATRQAALQKAEVQLIYSKQELERAQQLKEHLSPKVDLAALRKKERRIKLHISEAEADLATFRAAVSEMKVMGAEQRANLHNSQSALAKLDHDKCPTCSQEIPLEMVAPLRERVEELTKLVTEADEARARTIAEYQGEEHALAPELRDFRRQLADVRTEIDNAVSTEQTRERIDADIAEIQTRLAEAEAGVSDAQDAVEAAQKTYDELDATAKVLGIRGVRSQILSRTLTGLALVANTWLARIAGPPLKVTLKSYTAKKTGGTSDAISLEVEGAGGGHGYRAASGGERRRIDVAILLALADIAAASAQSRNVAQRPVDSADEWAQGTLFFDEVFDTLDSEGLESVIAIVQELAKDRAVVVISHSEELAAKLNPARHVKLR